MSMVSVFALRFLSVSLLNLDYPVSKETLRKRSTKTLCINKSRPILVRSNQYFLGFLFTVQTLSVPIFVKIEAVPRDHGCATLHEAAMKLLIGEQT